MSGVLAFLLHLYLSVLDTFSLEVGGELNISLCTLAPHLAIHRSSLLLGARFLV